MDGDGRAAEMQRTEAAHLRALIRQHENGIANTHRRVNDAAARTFEPRQLLSPERTLVEVECLLCVLADDERCKRVISGGNGLNGEFGHDGAPGWLKSSGTGRTRDREIDNGRKTFQPVNFAEVLARTSSALTPGASSSSLNGDWRSARSNTARSVMSMSTQLAPVSGRSQRALN